jgi:hypothetical protein
VRPLQGSGEDLQVSLSGGTEAVWSHDGSELFYRGNTDHGIYLVAAKVRASPTFDVVSRQNLFPVGDMAAAVPHANYDVSRDGRTFALVRRSPATRIMVIQNLPEMVKTLETPAKSAQ